MTLFGLTVFQLLAVVLLGGLLLRDLWRWSRSGLSAPVRVLRCAAWVGAAVAITIPNIVQKVAEALGIGRGADVVLYLFVLAFLWSSFFFYSRCLRLEREITELTRHIAIRDAARAPVADPPHDPVG
jgi:small membrane protein